MAAWMAGGREMSGRGGPSESEAASRRNPTYRTTRISIGPVCSRIPHDVSIFAGQDNGACVHCLVPALFYFFLSGYLTFFSTRSEEKLSNGWSPWVLDVRLQTEHDIVALPFTDQVAPHRTVQPDQIPKTGEVLVYCKAGVRGKKACSRLVELGVEPDRLYNLDGGIMRWQKEVDPSMPRY